MTNKSGFRRENLLGLSICIVALCLALFMQYGIGLEPCILCISQRLMYSGAAFFFLLAALHNPYFGGHRIYGIATLLFALVGAGLSSRQLYLQSLPADQVSECGPGFDYIVEFFPLTEVLMVMIQGTGNCATVHWRDPVFELSIAAWSLLTFTVLLMLCIRLVLAQPKVMLWSRPDFL
jgi:protein dithiol:quinone oxidoreductase